VRDDRRSRGLARRCGGAREQGAAERAADLRRTRRQRAGRGRDRRGQQRRAPPTPASIAKVKDGARLRCGRADDCERPRDRDRQPLGATARTPSERNRQR